MARQRKKAGTRNRVQVVTGFVNPYPYMSDPEAMVKLQLERFGVPFSWRYFDAPSQEAPTLRYLIPDFAPEFTLREYKAVIIVVGGFFGTLPGILDKSALAMVALEQDGWRGFLIVESDIRRNVREALLRVMPDLEPAMFKGEERPNPYGLKDLMSERLRRLGGQGLRKTHFVRNDESTDTRRNSNADSRRNRRRRRSRRTGASVRTPELNAPDV